MAGNLDGWESPFREERRLSVVDYWGTVKLLNVLRHLGVLSDSEMRAIAVVIEHNVFGKDRVRRR